MSQELHIKFSNKWPLDEYHSHLRQLLQQLLSLVNVKRCFAIITDDIHFPIYDRSYYESIGRNLCPSYMMHVNESQDLGRPGKSLELHLSAMKASDCDLYVITILNAGQVKRLLKYIYRNRSLNMQRKYILLHDSRLFVEDMLHLWSVFVECLFLKRLMDNSFTISTIAYPGILSGVLVAKQLATWSFGQRIQGSVFFIDKTKNLKGAQLPVAIAEHYPMVQLIRSSNVYQGVEIDIMNALAKALNFHPIYYNANVSDTMDWNDQQDQQNDYYDNETRLIDSLIIGEVSRHVARFAIGDLHLFQAYSHLVELSYPHNFECLTFLTPESTADNSWQTFILPFSGGMWAGVLLSLFVVGSVFYMISFLNAMLSNDGENNKKTFFRCLRWNRLKSEDRVDKNVWQRSSFRIALMRRRSTAVVKYRDIFDDYPNCILLTYSMLLYVALPRMPRNWPLRVLTGWYWIYCILLVATYRASFTAILANPAARITIDTLQELLYSHLPLSTELTENRQFFLDSSDSVAQQLGTSMNIMTHSNDMIARIAKGQCAYYDNEFYLRYLRSTDDSVSDAADAATTTNGVGSGSAALHIMHECVIQMPVVIALEKNSAIKEHVDTYIKYLAESGLIAKWLRDAIQRLPAEEEAPQEALMNLRKFWSSFVALIIGYLIAICAILAENWHFRHYIMKHPMYDTYCPSLYYNFKRLYPDQ
ncbi:uncharacterized protein Dwil_GK17029 [Drosophila willistoni]|uniref:Ionotropic glutamate receptor C-terminal domain-containing protein n=2 Tax=Drosophila willistoni TaxID=7260 RepID=B4MKM1_DROWI|nr:uncharacterized protein Dwil_GK17029 [Drosophila willistoni]